ncbi:hypothetical protein RvY_07037, partial [Ramazzottius varieornatus]
LSIPLRTTIQAQIMHHIFISLSRLNILYTHYAVGIDTDLSVRFDASWSCWFGNEQWPNWPSLWASRKIPSGHCTRRPQRGPWRGSRLWEFDGQRDRREGSADIDLDRSNCRLRKYFHSIPPWSALRRTTNTRSASSKRYRWRKRRRKNASTISSVDWPGSGRSVLR